MKHHLPPLDGLKAFESAARHLSFSLAAEELCITKSAISYQIRKLEEHLQCALFKRAVRQVYLTDAGQMMLQSTQHLFKSLGETIERVQGESKLAGVTIAATTYVAARWLSQHISTFNEHHPDVTVLLQHSVNTAEFKLSDVDLAIQWGRCKPNLDRQSLGQIEMPLYPAVSPALLQRHKIDSNGGFSAHTLLNAPFSTMPLLCEDRPQDLWQEWVNTGATNNGENSTLQLRDNPRRVISDANVRVQAAIDGQGLILADALMANELNSGLLLSPFNHQLHGYGYSLLNPVAQITNRHSEALKHWLSSRFTSLD